MNRATVIAAALSFAPVATSAEPAVLRALSGDPATARAAIAALRAQGGAGLEELMQAHAVALDELATQLEAGRPLRPELARLRAAVEGVAAQRDAHASGLFWHTDLDEALQEARRLGRPVLSLRLLGRLDEELSCANSRFFRVALYANADISRELASGWVLHWQTVRNAPRLTIDYGDGRTVERTITGNSLHLALASDGSVLDVLPGLHGPRPFLAWLGEMTRLSGEGDGLPPAARRSLVALHHQRAAERGGAPERGELRGGGAPGGAAAAPSAGQAMPMALSKMVVEAPVVRQLEPDAVDPGVEAASWDALSRGREADGRMDASSVRLFKAKLGRGADAVRARAAFERSMVRDGVANEQRFHRTIHGWLARDAAAQPDVLVARIYDELFLTPASDPWLGLVSPETFSAIERDGRR